MGFRVASWNVNGLRSMVRRDFDAWLDDNQFDVVCLQEVKVEEDLLTARWFKGYEAFWSVSRVPGRGGVATLVRDGRNASLVQRGFTDGQDPEGRVLVTDVAGFRIVNLYAPHSHRKLTRLPAKLRFLSQLTAYLEAQITARPSQPLILIGDLNIAHRDIDLANPRRNSKNAGFLPEERSWMDRTLASGFEDAFRRFEAGGGHYTWWSMLDGVRARNIGWRLDYALVDGATAARLENCSILNTRHGSDHCPIMLALSEPAGHAV